MKKLTVLLLVMMLVLGIFPVTAAASSEVPYQTYTFDKWGNTTPSPNGYLPSRSIGGAQLGCGNFSDAMDLFYSPERQELYVVDSGNARIIVLTKDLELKKELYGFGEVLFQNPQGIFVQPDGTMYVADMAAKQVAVGDKDGNLVKILPTPESNLLPDNFNYLPTKVVVDTHGRVYILSQGIYQGLIYLDTDGSFIKFFGPNEVEMTFRRQSMKLWKAILPDKAAATMQSFNPIEYGNIFMGSDEYIYATAAGSENGARLITKLNPLGIDCLPFKMSGSQALFSDVTVDENGVMTVLNTAGGNIRQMNESGSLMFAFGGIGDQVGLFQRAVSIVQMEEKLYVLDADKDTITEFRLTDFGSLVRNAIALYDAGLYQESIEPWMEVIRHNSNYLLAYTGLGKAYYQLKDYDTAMYYFRLANDRSNYSLAFREASLLHVRSSFGTIVLSVLGGIATIFVLRWVYWNVDFTPKKKRKEDRK